MKQILEALDKMIEGALSVPEKHQLAIAKKTLRYSDAGAKIMGGMTKDEAREFLRSIGWSKDKIRKWEK